MRIRDVASNVSAAVTRPASATGRSFGQNILTMCSPSIVKMLVLALAASLCACGASSEASKEGPARSGGSSASTSSSTDQWRGFKVGSFVKAKTTVSAQIMGRTTYTSTETTTTLAELTADKAVLDIEMTVMGNTSKARTEVPLTGSTQTGRGAMPVGAANVATGTETVVVAGKSLDCKTYEAETDDGGSKVRTKTWISDQIPGFLVKSVSISTGAMNSTTTMAAVDFKAN